MIIEKLCNGTHLATHMSRDTNISCFCGSILQLLACILMFAIRYGFSLMTKAWHGPVFLTSSSICLWVIVVSLAIIPHHHTFMPHLWALCFLVCASVRSSVRSSRFRLKFLVEVFFDEVEVQSTWNIVNMFPMIWSVLILMPN